MKDTIVKEKVFLLVFRASSGEVYMKMHNAFNNDYCKQYKLIENGFEMTLWVKYQGKESAQKLQDNIVKRIKELDPAGVFLVLNNPPIESIITREEQDGPVRFF